MKSFKDLKKEVSLVEFISNELGTSYIDTENSNDEIILVKRFDDSLLANNLPIYENLYSSIRNWIENTPKVKEYVFMPPLIEIGADYIIRPFYVYDIAIRDYMDKDDEDYVEPPELFAQMQRAVSQELSETSGKENIIRRILRKSLLEPTSKTIYGYEINKFIIVEPKIAFEDLIEWKELNQV